MNSSRFVILFALCFASPIFSAELNLQNYANARVILESHGKVDEYLLALGSYKKIAGSWRVDRQQRLSGSLARYTLELPDGHSASNGFDFYLDQLRNYTTRELFHCKGRDCGTSNSWANNHFKNQLLYGLDQFQQYGAYEVITADETPFYAAIYSVQRGNKRVYLQLDLLHVDKVIELGIASSPESIIKAMESNGYYVFPDLVADGSDGITNIHIKQVHLQALVDVLTKNSQWMVALVGHDYSSVPLTQQENLSRVYAAQLKAALQEKGIGAARLRTYGVGSLAPAGRGDRSARVEVVIIKD